MRMAKSMRELRELHSSQSANSSSSPANPLRNMAYKAESPHLLSTAKMRKFTDRKLKNYLVVGPEIDLPPAFPLPGDKKPV